jgi:hypothetical protein
MKRTVTVFLSLLFAGAAGARAQDNVPGDIVSLFQKRCAGCHKGQNPPKGLNWEAKKIEAAIDLPGREIPELKIIDTASPESSYVLKKVRGEKGIKGGRMPPSHALSTDEIKVLEDWILSLKKRPL